MKLGLQEANDGAEVCDTTKGEKKNNEIDNLNETESRATSMYSVKHIIVIYIHVQTTFFYKFSGTTSIGVSHIFLLGVKILCYK